MVMRFCSGCGSANELTSEFCGRCGIPLAVRESQRPPRDGDPPATDTPTPTEGASEPPDETRARRTRRIGPVILAIALAALATTAAVSVTLVIGHGRIVPPWSAPPPPHGGGSRSPWTVDLVRVSNRTVEPGGVNGFATKFTAPREAANISVNVNLSAAGCPSLPIALCGLEIALLTPANWSAFLSGKPLRVLWCNATALDVCPTLLSLRAHVGLTDRLAGAVLELVVWDPGLLPLSGSWDAEMRYTAPG